MKKLTESQKQRLKELLKKDLTRVERLILVLHDYEKITYKEIAQALDLTESRVIEIYNSIVGRLISQLEN